MSNFTICNDLLKILTGSTAFLPYVRLKGESLVLDLDVVQYDLGTIDNSSIHAALDFSNCFLSPLTII